MFHLDLLIADGSVADAWIDSDDAKDSPNEYPQDHCQPNQGEGVFGVGVNHKEHCPCNNR